MIEGVLGIIDKMRIEVFPSIEYNESEITKTIFVQINPESYSETKQIEYFEDEVIGGSGTINTFKWVGQKSLSFEFLFDSSGVVPPAQIEQGQSDNFPVGKAAIEALKPAVANPFETPDSIHDKLTEFQEALIKYQGDAHEPRYLRLIWGQLLFECRVSNMQINYTLFRNDGQPIRATVSCDFIQSTSYEEMLNQRNDASPDVTHQLTFKLQDRFSLLAEKVYESNNYYIDAARSNELLSFRDLPVGENLQFPPLK